MAVFCVVLMPFERLVLYYLRPSDRGQLGMMFHTGADAILWGALAAFICKDGALDRLRASRLRAAIPWICVAVAFVLCPVLVAVNRGFNLVAVPSIHAAAIVLFVLWLLSGEGGFLRSLLESWPMVRIGVLSYSIYIWHAIFTVWDGFPAALSSVPARWLCTLAASALSYYLVESPLRRGIRRWFSQSAPAH